MVVFYCSKTALTVEANCDVKEALEKLQLVRAGSKSHGQLDRKPDNTGKLDPEKRIATEIIRDYN